jgi:hypothetical protein
VLLKLKIIMQNSTPQRKYANNHISIDTVVLGFDGNQLCVLLIPQELYLDNGDVYEGLKLPGNIIYQDEDFEEAAHRILDELTGIKRVNLFQFKTYGSKNRTSNKDIVWLEQTLHITVERIVTTAYLAIVKLDASMQHLSIKHSVKWVPVDQIGELAFDHNVLVEDALSNFRKLVHYNPLIMYELLPRKFTILQLRILYELVSQKRMDIRNFQKRMAQLPYVIPMDEFEQGVRHRAARYFKFDKVIYNKTRRS